LSSDVPSENGSHAKSFDGAAANEDSVGWTCSFQLDMPSDSLTLAS
jgi:hypothetical protein